MQLPKLPDVEEQEFVLIADAIIGARGKGTMNGFWESIRRLKALLGY